MRTDNGSEFAGDFGALCKASGIVHRRITVGNSKANGQVERMIRTLKEAIRRGLTKTPTFFWSDHVTAALTMLQLTSSRMTGFAPFMLATGRRFLLPSVVLPPLSDLPDAPTAEQEEHYYASVSVAAERLRTLGMQHMRKEEACARAAVRRRE